MANRMRIGIGVPTAESWHHKMGTAMASMMVYHTHRNPRDQIFIISGVSSLVHDNRNGIWKIAKESKCDYLLFLDSDIEVPQNTIERLIGHQKRIVGAAYSTRKTPVLVNCFDHKEEGVNYERLKHQDAVERVNTGNLQRVAGLGAGCLLIHKEVINTVEQPVFEFESVAGQWQCCSEDWVFCRKMGKQGFEIYCDWKLSGEVGHWGGTTRFIIGGMQV